jgi:hypothetical protein
MLGKKDRDGGERRRRRVTIDIRKNKEEEGRRRGGLSAQVSCFDFLLKVLDLISAIRYFLYTWHTSMRSMV